MVWEKQETVEKDSTDYILLFGYQQWQYNDRSNGNIKTWHGFAAKKQFSICHWQMTMFLGMKRTGILNCLSWSVGKRTLRMSFPFHTNNSFVNDRKTCRLQALVMLRQDCHDTIIVRENTCSGPGCSSSLESKSHFGALKEIICRICFRYQTVFGSIQNISVEKNSFV